MTRIGLIRHGITDWNVERRVQGQTDIPLNDDGRSQARALAERLKGENWHLIVSSDLSRAKDTATIVAESMGLSVQTDTRLREMHCGEIEGTTLEERIRTWGEEWESLQLGVEDDDSIMERGAAFVSELAAANRGKNILIFSHGALIAMTVKRLIPHENKEEHLQNTSVTILEQNDSDWSCDLYNCAKHLNSQ